MSNAQRVAELQRTAYGAGATDAERAAAVDELEALRRGASRPAANGGSSEAGPPSDPEVPRASDPWVDADDPFAGVTEEAPPTGGTAASASPAIRWSVIAGAVALAIGFGAGWVGGSQTAVQLTGSGAAPDRDRDVTFDLAPPEDDESAAAIPIQDAPAMAVFERPQVPEDVPTFVDPAFDASTYRRLVALPDGATVHAVRAAHGSQLCLHVDVPERGSASTCTDDGIFPARGMESTASFEPGGSYAVVWHASGEVGVTSSPTG